MVNWESSALCGINIDDNKPYVEASRLNCKATFRWISQTILLLAAGDRKMQGKLEKWKRYNLSKRRLCHLVNFFWEEHSGSELNHLVKWNLVTRTQLDGGLEIGGLKTKNLALLSNWGWRLIDESSLWSRVVESIHGKSSLGWHTNGKVTCSVIVLRSAYQGYGY
ncbi:Beta-hexosaminidase subunit [Cucumis melo var. makuwa]|uniref:Beta-hexosaminidase subunit n=1 Tax=Cucumis melo var. makuwa TaxID=1194695 RepID=A0A5A7VBZ2_CUCMM|nr:Beta-hexosaminidase subunit [Cucumis melo var. makuwa]TYK19899.1 Beta-hexosaminidase subunit [Cucumis melo var. makuwa]